MELTVSIRRRASRRQPARKPTARREAWRGWAGYAAAVHLQLLGLAVLRLGPGLVVAQVVVLAATLASALLSVVHDAGHSEFSRRPWVNVVAAQTAVPMGLWIGQYRVKHRVHHSQANVYPVDESTTPHPLLRVHPLSALRPWHRLQHLYAPALYALAWVGDLRSQVRYLLSGRAGDTVTGTLRSRASSYVAEKALTVALLLPYVALAGAARSLTIGAAVLGLASLFAALVLIGGHVNVGLADTPDAAFVERIFATTAAFSTTSPWMRRLTGGLTHHHVHHLRAHAPRSSFDSLHRELVVSTAEQHQLSLVEFPSLGALVVGHFRRLRELGVDPAAVATTSGHSARQGGQRTLRGGKLATHLGRA